MKKLPDLNQLLEYKNPLVIRRFQQNFPDFSSRAEQLFIDMLNYLWLSAKHELDLDKNPNHPDLQFVAVMHEEMRLIDHMWHEFILITKDYHQFCYQYFGQYLHHVPNMREELQWTEEQMIQQLTLFLDYVYEALGEQTLIRWFSEHLNEPQMSELVS